MIYEDPGISGSKFENRPEILKLIQRIQSKDNDIEKVYSFKLDRISRSTHEIHWFIHLCVEHNVHYIALKDGIDTSNKIMGKILISIFGLVSELELENIKVRVKASLSKRNQEGKSSGGRYVSLGYQRLKDVKGKSYFAINEDEAKIIRLIFDSYIDGLTVKQIAIQLNALNYRTRTNSIFTENSIEKILKNPIYIGKIRLNHPEPKNKGDKNQLIDALHEPIISIDTWEMVQSRITENKIIKNHKEDYLFSGKIICYKCGARMYGKYAVTKNNRHKYYSCHNNSRVISCDAPTIRTDITDKLLTDSLLRLIKSSEFAEYLKKMLINETSKLNETTIDESLNEEISLLEERKNNLSNQYSQGFIDEDHYSIAIKIINDRIRNLNTQMIKETNSIKKSKEKFKRILNQDIYIFTNRLVRIISNTTEKNIKRFNLIKTIVSSIDFCNLKTMKFTLRITKDLFVNVIGPKIESRYGDIDFQFIFKN